MTDITRRQVSTSLIQAAACYQIYRLAFGSKAFAKAVEPVTDRWLKGLFELVHNVRAGVVPIAEWHEQIAALHHTVPMTELMTYIDFDRIVAQVAYPKDVAAVRQAPFPKVAGLPSDLGFHQNIFSYRRGVATTPHVHNNLVSAHLVLRGTIHARTFDRIADESDAVILKPSIDRVVGSGEVIAMTDDRDNGHWFVATSGHAYTLDLPISAVNLGKHYALKANKYGQIFVDPTTKPRRDGSIRAPIITLEESKKRFGGVS